MRIYFPNIIDDLNRLIKKAKKPMRELGVLVGATHPTMLALTKETNKRKGIELEVAMTLLDACGQPPIEYLVRHLSAEAQIELMKMQEADRRLLKAVGRAIKHADQRKVIEAWLDAFDASWRVDKGSSGKDERRDVQRGARVSGHKKAAVKVKGGGVSS